MNHVEHTARGTNNDMSAAFKSTNVIHDIGTTNTSMALDVQMIAQCENDFLNLKKENKRMSIVKNYTD